MVIIFIVFAAEMAIMLLMPIMASSSSCENAILDSLLLTLVITPVLWRLAIRPLRQYAQECERAQEQLRRVHDELEATVAQRTAEVQSARAHLQAVLDASPVAVVALDRDRRVTQWNQAAEGLFGWRAVEILGAPSPVIPPDERPGFERLWEKILAGESFTELQRQRMRRDGSLVDVSISTAPLRDAGGRIVGSVAVLVDITERKEVDARVETTNALLRLFTESASRAQYMDSVVELLRDFSGCSVVGLRLLDGRDRIPYVACVGLSQEFLASEDSISVEKDQCACTRVVSGKPEPQDLLCTTPGGSFHCNDTMELLEGLSETEREEFRGVCARHGFASVAAIPIRNQDRILGVFHLADRAEGRVPPKLVEAIESMGLLVGEALHKFELQEELGQQADELRAMAARLAEVEDAERRQLSRELHDQIGQNLAGLSVNLRIIGDLLSSDDVEQIHSRVKDSMALLEATATRIRDVMAELRPPALDDFGLLVALWGYGEQLSQRGGIRVSVEGEDLPERLPSLVESSLFRIAQEALTNVVRHAAASRATVTLESYATGVRLSITDDGKGFVPQTYRQPGKSRQRLGLVIMRERAQAIGGLLRVESEPGKGTRVVVGVAIPC